MYSQLPPATWYFPIISLHFGFGGPLAWVPSNKRQDWPANLFRESSPTCPTTEKPIPNDILPLVNPAVVLVSAQLRAFQLHVRELHDRLAYAKWKVLTPVTEKTRDHLPPRLRGSECTQTTTRGQRGLQKLGSGSACSCATCTCWLTPCGLGTTTQSRCR